MPSAKTARGRDSRERLEKAALACFVKRGIDAATTKEIARLAGMAEGNLYRHYASKEDLAWALYQGHLGRFVAHLEEAVRSKRGARPRLQALLHRFRELFESDVEAYTYIVLAQHHLLRRTPKGMRTPTDVVAEVLREGQKAREVRKGDAALLSAIIIGIVVRVTLLKLHGLLEGDLDLLEAEAEAACWRVVRA